MSWYELTGDDGLENGGYLWPGRRGGQRLVGLEYVGHVGREKNKKKKKEKWTIANMKRRLVAILKSDPRISSISYRALSHLALFFTLDLIILQNTCTLLLLCCEYNNSSVPFCHVQVANYKNSGTSTTEELGGLHMIATGFRLFPVMVFRHCVALGCCSSCWRARAPKSYMFSHLWKFFRQCFIEVW